MNLAPGSLFIYFKAAEDNLFLKKHEGDMGEWSADGLTKEGNKKNHL